MKSTKKMSLVKTLRLVVKYEFFCFEKQDPAARQATKIKPKMAEIPRKTSDPIKPRVKDPKMY